MQSTFLTFQSFVNQAVSHWGIPESEVIICDGWDGLHNRGWHFSINANDNYQISHHLPGENGIVGGGVLEFSHRSGYAIDCMGLASSLTWDEAKTMFLTEIPGEGTFRGSYAGKPIKGLKDKLENERLYGRKEMLLEYPLPLIAAR